MPQQDHQLSMNKVLIVNMECFFLRVPKGEEAAATFFHEGRINFFFFLPWFREIALQQQYETK